jgi:N-methylhydantoinase A/oxoprolinase/acetone carboxylase beta subunit
VRIGVDTGGTFTDVVFDDGRIAKVPSTPHDPAVAVRTGCGPGAIDILAHGTTVATNALLEGRLATVTLVTNAGLEDVIEIGRQNRPSLYDQWIDRPAPIVPRTRRVGVTGRLDAAGREIEPLGETPCVPDGTDVVAVCLVHSDLNPQHELAVGAALRSRGIDVVCSAEISPEFREFERVVTTVIDAALRPLCREYLDRLAGLAATVLVMSSAGGLIDLGAAAAHPARLLLSGPAAGVRAAAAVASANGFGRAVSFDMGGTSTDVCLIDGGVPEPSATFTVGGYPVRLPSLAIHTIGAGGGSIAAIDSGGVLAVGPRSAGAVPGPACYGRGGGEPTVTDADVVLRRIPPDVEFPGLGRLDASAAAAALGGVGVAAADVVRVVDTNMTEAVRRVTVAEGIDPRECVLVAFGGAGPLHAVAVAEALDMPAVIVPARAGVLSAVGLLTAPEQLDLVASVPHGAGPSAIAAVVDDLTSRAAAALPGASTEPSFDCRYAGQSHEVRVRDVGVFHSEHERRNGWRRDDRPVDVVSVRVTARRAAPVALHDLPAEPPPAVVGPAVVARPDCTIWVPEGWRGEPGNVGALVLRRTGS